ncbi:hypothetical protein ACF0H5_020802 [Mactra antiquata]
MDQETEKTDDVSTSSGGDVYSSPIALGFEALNEVSTECSSSMSVMYGPSNYNDLDTSTTLMAYNKDIPDDAALRGKCGLYNLGNTCFMNAGLQCLMSTMPVVKFLLGYYQNKRSIDETLLGQFQRLFVKIWSGQFSIVHPKDFKQTLGIYHSQFQDYRQHDCQEFLALLLDSLHEHLNFKGCSTNQLVEAGPSSEKPPITFEHNINNRPTPSSKFAASNEDYESNESSRTGFATNSSLTFDNNRDTNVNISGNVLSNELKVDSCEKRKVGISLAGFTVNQISEDSNHSSFSEHSSDSEHCSVMKNLKLRSSPIASQSSGGVTPRLVNELGSKYCDVSSSDDTHVRKDTDEGFKRVQSLQDFRSKDGCESVLLKASSDNDLVKKVSCDPDEAGDFEVMSSNIDATSQSVPKSDFKSSQCDNYEQVASCSYTKTDDQPVLLNNAVSSTNVPSLEDLYAKETKTLNTNVLAFEYMEDNVATDSDKFSKHDNTTARDVMVEEEDILNNVVESSPKNDGFEMPKKIKDVNIRADKKSKSPKGACGANSMTSEKEDCFTLNSVKRMKFEGTEKNLQMQEICKIQKEALICEALRVEKPKNIERVSFVHEPSPSVDSDIDSDIGEEHDDMDVSENEVDNVMVKSPATLSDGAGYTTTEILAAEEAWQKYLSKNDSIIVNTFQGQFKSTVVCARCSQVSVTFEPFMYLSVPVPHAMDRQLCLTVISLQSEPTQVLLEMHKQDKILKVKQQLYELIGIEPSNIIIAEVLDWHISRILEDNTMLRYINDSSRKVYAFEVDQCAIGDAGITENELNPNLADSQDSMTVHTDVFNDMGSFSVSSSMNFDPSNDPSTSNYDGNQSDCVADSSRNDLIGTSLWEWNQSGTEGKRRGSLETESGDTVLNADSTTGTGYCMDEEVTRSDSREAMETINKSTMSSSIATVTTDWKSCAICLEEMPENELMVHTTCGGTFCSACLEMSAQHYRDSTYCCPVCSTPADMTEDFVPLTNAANHKPKTRIVAIPISYRCETDISGADNPFLFAHPSLLNLPSNLSGVHIYSYIQHVKPHLTNFRILLTDGTGLKCSRCLYMEHCSGCEIPIDGEVILRPGDHLTVSVQCIKEDLVISHQHLVQHKSMEHKRLDEPVTLLDCFRAFTQSEELDEHNPWFCPHCKENQRAKKTMTVWQYPDTLIIQLKRFVFHEFTSTKVDNKVMFPLDNLDLNGFISGPKTKNLMYNLYSLVCHFGGANSGHYTAYAKHPENGTWYYYNDETVTEHVPGNDEYDSTYVLFYQRKGTDKALQIPEDLDLVYDFDGNEENSGAIPNITYSPPNEELSVQLNAVPSTSFEHVTPSSGSCDLTDCRKVDNTDQSECRENADSQFVRIELVEADSTGPSYDFYY